jgi:hypothetical protein
LSDGREDRDRDRGPASSPGLPRGRGGRGVGPRLAAAKIPPPRAALGPRPRCPPRTARPHRGDALGAAQWLAGRVPPRASGAGIVVEDGIDAYERLTGKLAIESLPPSSATASGGPAPPASCLGA